MKRQIIVLLTVVFGACQTSAPPPAERGVEGTRVAAEEGMLRTERESYAAGEPVRLVLDNQSGDPLGGNLCMSALERREDQQWVDVPGPSDEVCTGELRVVAPGGQLSHEFRFRQDLPPGEYRFRTRVENIATNVDTHEVSNPFQLQR